MRSYPFYQRSSHQVAEFWDSTAEWRLTYFNDLANERPERLSPVLRLEQEFVIAEEKATMHLLEQTDCGVVELGCGVGRSLLPLAKLYPSRSFIGLDFAATQVRLFQEQIRRARVRNCEVLHSDVRDAKPPVPAGEVGLVLVCNQTIGTFLGSTREPALRLVRALLEGGGKALIGGFDRVEVAAACYREWGVDLINCDVQTGFVELRDYNSWWAPLDELVTEFAAHGMNAISVERVGLGYLCTFEAT